MSTKTSNGIVNYSLVSNFNSRYLRNLIILFGASFAAMSFLWNKYKFEILCETPLPVESEADTQQTQTWVEYSVPLIWDNSEQTIYITVPPHFKLIKPPPSTSPRPIFIFYTSPVSEGELDSDLNCKERDEIWSFSILDTPVTKTVDELRSSLFFQFKGTGPGGLNSRVDDKNARWNCLGGDPIYSADIWLESNKDKNSAMISSLWYSLTDKRKEGGMLLIQFSSFSCFGGERAKHKVFHQKREEEVYRRIVESLRLA